MRAVNGHVLAAVAALAAAGACHPAGSAHAAPNGTRASGVLPVNGVNLYYETAGRGPAVVLLHGGFLNHRQWDEQVGPLSRDHYVVRYDARGYGRTPIGDSPYAHHEDLAALLRHLRIDRAHLVALSAGVSIAADFALVSPASVRSLVLGAAPLPGYDVGPEFTDGIRAIIKTAVDGDLERARELIWAFAPFRVAAGMPAVRARLDQMILRDYSWSHNRPDAPQRKRVAPPSGSRLGEIAAPVLVVVGDGEMPALVRQADFMAATIPGARKVTIKGAGHFVNLEQPRRFTGVVRDWLRGRKR
jgi:3-oxoadipate enol-lactonase